MYLRKIVLAIALIGLVVSGVVVYKIYNAIFAPNTAFANEQAFIYIPTGASFNVVEKELEPLLKDLNSFVAVAKRKGYVSNIKAGKYALKHGMSNNDIVKYIAQWEHASTSIL